MHEEAPDRQSEKAKLMSLSIASGTRLLLSTCEPMAGPFEVNENDPFLEVICTDSYISVVDLGLVHPGRTEILRDEFGDPPDESEVVKASYEADEPEAKSDEDDFVQTINDRAKKKVEELLDLIDPLEGEAKRISERPASDNEALLHARFILERVAGIVATHMDHKMHIPFMLVTNELTKASAILFALGYLDGKELAGL